MLNVVAPEEEFLEVGSPQEDPVRNLLEAVSPEEQASQVFHGDQQFLAQIRQGAVAEGEFLQDPLHTRERVHVESITDGVVVQRDFFDLDMEEGSLWHHPNFLFTQVDAPVQQLVIFKLGDLANVLANDVSVETVAAGGIRVHGTGVE